MYSVPESDTQTTDDRYTIVTTRELCVYTITKDRGISVAYACA